MDDIYRLLLVAINFAVSYTCWTTSHEKDESSRLFMHYEDIHQ